MTIAACTFALVAAQTNQTALWPQRGAGTSRNGAATVPVNTVGLKSWSFPTLNSVKSSPAISANGVLFVGSMDSYLYALNTTTGAQLWKYKTGGGLTSSPGISVDGTTVYIGAIDSYVRLSVRVSGSWMCALYEAISSQ